MKRRWALVFGMTLFAIGLVLGSIRTLPTAQLGQLKDRLTGQAPAGESGGARALGEADALLSGEADVMMVGDSITQFGRWNEMFPVSRIANRGIAGDTVEGVLARVAIIKQVKARQTFLMVGINDLALAGVEPMALSERYELLVAALRPDTRLFIQSTLPCSSFRCDRRLLGRIAVFNLLLAQIAQRQRVPFIDVAGQMAPDGVLPDALSDDGVHLNGEGYQRWSKVIAPHLQSATKNSAQNSSKRL